MHDTSLCEGALPAGVSVRASSVQRAAYCGISTKAGGDRITPQTALGKKATSISFASRRHRESLRHVTPWSGWYHKAVRLSALSCFSRAQENCCRRMAPCHEDREGPGPPFASRSDAFGLGSRLGRSCCKSDVSALTSFCRASFTL